MMPLTKKEKDTITRIAVEYGADKVWLFGSMTDPDRKTKPNDIDLAVDGLPPERFFSFYGELLMRLDKPVDLIDMCEDLPIASDAREKGVIIFDKSRRTRKTATGDRTRKTAHR